MEYPFRRTRCLNKVVVLQMHIYISLAFCMCFYFPGGYQVIVYDLMKQLLFQWHNLDIVVHVLGKILLAARAFLGTNCMTIRAGVLHLLY